MILIGIGHLIMENVGLNYTNNHIDNKMADTAGSWYGLSITVRIFTNYNLTN